LLAGFVAHFLNNPGVTKQENMLKHILVNKLTILLETVSLTYKSGKYALV
jgi:hypothetical protein